MVPSSPSGGGGDVKKPDYLSEAFHFGALCTTLDTLEPLSGAEYIFSLDDINVLAKRSKCNARWAELHLKWRVETDSTSQALRDAYTHVDALIDDEAGRLLMRTAIKRIYDAK